MNCFRWIWRRPNVLFFLTAILGLKACITSPSPDLRHWRCKQDIDCNVGDTCIQKHCRPSCQTQADCLDTNQEQCLKAQPGTNATHCIPTCDIGETRECKLNTTNEGKHCQQGTQTCNRSYNWDACQTKRLDQSEICNNIDDDCNGLVDDNIPQVGQSCATGQIGACASGLTTCLQGTLRCIAPGATQEQCDGKDNNCNGEIDEGRICENTP